MIISSIKENSYNIYNIFLKEENEIPSFKGLSSQVARPNVLTVR